MSAAAILGVSYVVGVAVAEPAPPYRDLLVQAQQSAPRLAEAAASVGQAEGLADQAGARPNPTLDVQAENLGGGKPFETISPPQTTVSVAQTFELGGKRVARVSAGNASVDAARAKLRQITADYAYDLANAYADADAAERRVQLATEGVSLAQEDLRAARALVEAGKEAELRRLQSDSAVTTARAGLDAAEADRAGALAKLTALSGSAVPFTSVAEDLLRRPRFIIPPTAIDPLSAPAVITAEADRQVAARRVRVEQTRAAPDVTASLGARRISGVGSTAMVAGMSVALPLFDRNRGNISAAQAELRAAEARLNAARLDAEAELRTALFQANAAQARETAAVQGEEAASEAYRLTRIGYESGKAALIELIAARRALADARNLTIEAQLARQRAEASLARLQGRTPFGVQP